MGYSRNPYSYQHHAFIEIIRRTLAADTGYQEIPFPSHKQAQAWRLRFYAWRRCIISTMEQPNSSHFRDIYDAAINITIRFSDTDDKTLVFYNDSMALPGIIEPMREIPNQKLDTSDLEELARTLDTTSQPTQQDMTKVLDDLGYRVIDEHSPDGRVHKPDESDGS